MTIAFIICEYRHGHKQVLLEDLQKANGSYRVFTVNRYNTLEAAKQAYLADIPVSRKEASAKAIEEYAEQNNIKPTPTNKKAPAPVYFQKGKKK